MQNNLSMTTQKAASELVMFVKLRDLYRQSCLLYERCNGINNEWWILYENIAGTIAANKTKLENYTIYFDYWQIEHNS